MATFGGGQMAAATLRARVLEFLGAEPEWITGDHRDRVMTWTSGPARTIFEVQEGAANAPDLGVLRIWTPVAEIGNAAAARTLCNSLNLYTTTNRWTVASTWLEPDGAEVLQVNCAFVVSPGSAAVLEDFTLSCVREQIAIATAKMTDDIADLVGGIPCRFAGPSGSFRDEWHEVVYYYDRVIGPDRDLPATGLLRGLAVAFEGLKREMFAEETGAWFSAGGVDADGFTCEMPFAWAPYPAGVIGGGAAFPGHEMPPTVLVEGSAEANPQVGNGLLLAMRVPAEQGDDPEELASQLNLLDTGIPGVTHSIGAWVINGGQVSYCVYLPVALTERGGDLPAVIREVLLTLARQALLSRRVLVPSDYLDIEDRSADIGLAAAEFPPGAGGVAHGLAWGETGEGRNPAVRVLDQIYDTCVGADTDWSDVRTDGFTWWPYRQAQEITAALLDLGDVSQAAEIRISTEVRKEVASSPSALSAVARINAELTQSALVLHNDGRLELACRLLAHEGTDHRVARWAPALAADQFIMARDLAARLAGLGAEATSGHPVSGLRPEPDVLFGIRAVIAEGAAAVRAGLTPVVPLLAVAGQYGRPHQLGMRNAAAMTFGWQPSGVRADVPADPLVRAEIRRGDSECGPGWLVDSYLPVRGDAVAKARWCNDRNLELLSAGSHHDLTVISGWGLTADEECCLSSWMSPYLAPDYEALAAGLLSNVLRYHQSAILSALFAEPAAVPDDAPAPERLSEGLAGVIDTFGQILQYPDGYRGAVESKDADVVVSLTATGDDVGAWALAEMSEANGRPASRSMLHIPLTGNRTELGLMYAALLSQSLTRLPTWIDDGNALLPGEHPGWPITDRQVSIMLARLEDEGVLQYDDEAGWVFEVGAVQAQFEVAWPDPGPQHAYVPLRLAGIIGGPMPEPGIGGMGSRDLDVLGSWAQRSDGVAYEVILPPMALVWTTEEMVTDMLTKVGQHVIRKVQRAGSAVY
jgi:hypothetical protein